MSTGITVWPGSFLTCKAQTRSLDYRCAVSSCYKKSLVLNRTKMFVFVWTFNCDDVDTLLTKRKQKFAGSFARIHSILSELLAVWYLTIATITINIIFLVLVLF